MKEESSIRKSEYFMRGRESARRVTAAGILSAIAYLLMLIEIPLPLLIPSFIKFDFSDLPALIGLSPSGRSTGSSSSSSRMLCMA